VARATPRVSIVVPVWNELDGVARILEDSALPGHELVFVDAGSTDGTTELISRHACESCVLLRQQAPGLSAAVTEGLAAARGEILVTMDGDGAHRIADVPALIALIQEKHDLVVATRYGRHGSGMPGRRWSDRWASRLAAAAFRRRYGIALSDPLHGFRARTRRFHRMAAPVLRSVSGNVWMGIEALLAARWLLPATEISIPYGRRISGEEHKRLVPQGLLFTRYLLIPPRIRPRID
jgi:glycosyltransferase involved in cell wall biosynthesis